MTDRHPFITDFLEHHGVKGMKWGIINKDDISKDSSSFQKNLEKNPPKPLTPEQKRNVAKNSKKFSDQREVSEDDRHGWRPTGKQVAIAATGAIVVGGIISVAAYKHHQGLGSKPFKLEQYEKLMRSADTPEWLHAHSDEHMSIHDFQQISHTSEGRIWGHGDMVTKDLFAQKEMTFPKGHQFFRVSHGTETSFNPITYMLPDKECLARYQLGWKDSITNVIHFDAKEEIRVPDLYTRLEATRESLVRRGDTHISPQTVLDHYNAELGGSWRSDNAKGIITVLKERGFHAIPDDMDQGVYGKLPLILFDPSRVTDKVTIPNKDVDFKELEGLLSNVPNRR